MTYSPQQVDCLSAAAAVVAPSSHAASNKKNKAHVNFPISKEHSSLSKTTDKRIRAAFERIVDSTDFFESTSSSSSTNNNSKRMSASVPLLGDNVKINLQRKTGASPPRTTQSNHYQLSIEGDKLSQDEVGWICVKFFECRDELDGLLETQNLQDVVSHHFGSSSSSSEARQELDYGHPPSDAKLAGSSRIERIFDRGTLDTLKSRGFVVIDKDLPSTTEAQHQQLDQFLDKKSHQCDSIRTDMVHFLTRDEAKECGLLEHYDVLMGMSSYLNDHYDHDDDDDDDDDYDIITEQQKPPTPVYPATPEAPLTNPEMIQLAEYQHGGFYLPHSDNSIRQDGVRNNFRRFTAILYCNDDWKEDFGGALRIYDMDSTTLVNVDDALEECEYHDVMPKNGRLLLFDSRMVHSVEPVVHPNRVRRALTLWIKEPTSANVVSSGNC